MEVRDIPPVSEAAGATPAGLSEAEARERLRIWGANELTGHKAGAFFREAGKILFDPMGLMLLALGVLYWFLGNKTDSAILLFAWLPVIGIDVLLEIRAGRALRALRASVDSKAKVFRGGEIRSVPARLLVPGDLIFFEEGKTFPADGVVVESSHLEVSEALLTGESIPILKKAGSDFSAGTMVLTGRGQGLIRATGRSTKIGSVAGLLDKVQKSESPLRKKIGMIVRWIVWVALATALVLFVVNWIRSGNLSLSLIASLTLAMAAIPEEFPVVFTLFLSLGAWRLSRRGVLVKSLPSVEALGGVDVICTDKTGTLTQGQFRLEEIRPVDPSVENETLWRAAVLACEPQAVDSLEISLLEKAREICGAEKIETWRREWKLAFDHPFDAAGKHMSHVWKRVETGEMFLAMKGAEEGVREHCRKLPTAGFTSGELAASGKRILALAGKRGQFSGRREDDERDLDFLGYLIFSDPIRSSAKEAIAACQDAGIEIKMLTGDHLLTAHAVADQIGIRHNHALLYTGAMLEKMNDAERQEAYLRGMIFARLRPEEKFEMLRGLRAAGKVVAMTGDGVNDAPALKYADIGISMGQDATDAAKSSAQMILMKNDFGGIVDAVFEGRRIFSNLKSSFSYLLSFHVPVVLFSLIPPLFNWPAVLMPLHLVTLHILVHPISAFSFENLETRAQKKIQKSLLSRGQMVEALASGFLLTILAVVLFLWPGHSPETARSLVFALILFRNVFFVFAGILRARFGGFLDALKSPRLWISTGSIALFAVLATRVPPVAHLFHLEVLPWQTLAVLFALSSLPSVWRLFLFLKK